MREKGEQFDSVERAYLEIPMDNDGVVLPEYRERAAHIRRILREREREEKQPQREDHSKPRIVTTETESRMSEPLEEISSLVAEKSKLADRIERIDEEIERLLDGGGMDIGGGLKIVRGRVSTRVLRSDKPPKAPGVLNAIYDLLDDETHTKDFIVAQLSGRFTLQQIAAAITQATRHGGLVKTQGEDGIAFYERGKEDEQEDAA